MAPLSVAINGEACDGRAIIPSRRRYGASAGVSRTNIDEKDGNEYSKRHLLNGPVSTTQRDHFNPQNIAAA